MGDRLTERVSTPRPAHGPADLDGVYRAEFGLVVAVVTRLVGDIGLAEDAAHEAFVDALRTWPERGTPSNPGAWLTTAARNRVMDRLRRESSRLDRETAAVAAAPPPVEPVASHVPDDRLAMIFACCHPALAPESQVALMLRFVAGLRTAEIARAFLQPEHTVAQRLSRAKAKIRDAVVPVRVPAPQALAGRLPSVLSCVYLVFSEGYFATTGPSVVRDELCDEALRLGRLVCELLPGEPEVHALLALMLLHDSRRAVRRTAEGPVPLEEQDRGAWDRAAIGDGLRHLAAASGGGSGPYLAQARVAAAHAVAPSWAATDWRTIVAGYDELRRHTESPAVAVNRAVALGFRDGFERGLAELDAVVDHPRLAHGPLAVAARADLLRRAGRFDEAAVAYREALRRTSNDEANTFLTRRLRESERSAGRASEV